MKGATTGPLQPKPPQDGAPSRNGRAAHFLSDKNSSYLFFVAVKEGTARIFVELSWENAEDEVARQPGHFSQCECPAGEVSVGRIGPLYMEVKPGVAPPEYMRTTGSANPPLVWWNGVKWGARRGRVATAAKRRGTYMSSIDPSPVESRRMTMDLDPDPGGQPNTNHSILESATRASDPTLKIPTYMQPAVSKQQVATPQPQKTESAGDPYGSARLSIEEIIFPGARSEGSQGEGDSRLPPAATQKRVSTGKKHSAQSAKLFCTPKHASNEDRQPSRPSSARSSRSGGNSPRNSLPSRPSSAGTGSRPSSAKRSSTASSKPHHSSGHRSSTSRNSQKRASQEASG